MAMNVGSSSSGEDEVMMDINTTPLIDVMLVLIIMLIITIPVVTQSIAVKLPNETNLPRQTKPENVEISVNKDGDVFWNLQFVPDSNVLVERQKKDSVLDPQPEVHIRGDQESRYESIGRVVFACQRAGILKISFVTEPPAKG